MPEINVYKNCNITMRLLLVFVTSVYVYAWWDCFMCIWQNSVSQIVKANLNIDLQGWADLLTSCCLAIRWTRWGHCEDVSCEAGIWLKADRNLIVQSNNWSIDFMGMRQGGSAAGYIAQLWRSPSSDLCHQHSTILTCTEVKRRNYNTALRS